MGKHNGKARNKQGEHVGALLRAAVKRRGRGGGGAGGGGEFAHRHTTDVPAGGNIQSVLEQDDLAELMAMADLADRDFAADREESQVLVVSGPPGTGAAFQGPRELTAAERAAAEREHAEALRIPRRPAWDEDTTPEQLDANERASFLEWRRRLAKLEESGASGLVLTPFERNLQVWRQLWRVLERSDVVVQVVDARDPLQYASVDLAAAAAEYDSTKRTMLLLNKSDLLPPRVRRAWARHFDGLGVPYAFWSAFAAGEAHARTRSDMSLLYPGGGVAAAPARVVSARQRFHHRGVLAASPCCTQRGPRSLVQEEEDEADDNDPRTRVLSTPELLRRLEAFARSAVEERERRDGVSGSRRRRGGAAFEEALDEEEEFEEEEEEEDAATNEDDEDEDNDDPDDAEQASWSEDASPGEISSAAASEAASAPASPSAAPRAPRRLVVGLVGYPNVGKSSTINAIFGSKKTAVAPTPGKTKHFQTLAVSGTLTLCDCPGLVLPRVAASKADMVAAGVVPIDRLTDVRAPVGVVARRAGRRQLEAAYGLKGLRAGAGGGGEAEAEAEAALRAAGGGEPPVTAAKLLRSLAQARGWVSGAGMPDEARAGRQVLKDYTCGKLLHCALPPPKGGSWAPLTADDDDGGGGGAAAAAAGSGQQATEATGPDTPAGAAAATVDPIPLSAADLDLLEGLSLEQRAAPQAGRQRGSGGQQRGGGGGGAGDGGPPRRAGHKFHQKAAKAAARKAVPAGASGYTAALAADEDGETLRTGKRGGIVRG
jgi:large subunit GTPase 1